MRLAVVLLIAAAAALSAATLTSGATGHGRPEVVATTTQAADLVRAVAGNRVAVHGILEPNSDPHDYEVRPRDVKALVPARLVVRSGGDVDGWLVGAIDASGTRAPVLDLLGAVGAEGEDPHWWQDPRRAERAVAAIRAALTTADPAGARVYAAAAHAYTTRLQALDAAVTRCLAGLPRAHRTLVTTHDALDYYARRYGLTVVGTVIPSLSTQAQPSSGDVSRLIATIRRTGTAAVFAERSVNPKVEHAIAAATHARVGSPLYADALGPPASAGATYLDSIRANTLAIADGLGGGRVPCSLPR